MQVSTGSTIEELLQSIADLQDEEQRTLQQLNKTSNPADAQKYIDRINQLSTMRTNLYWAIAMYNMDTMNTVDAKLSVLQQQKSSVEIMEQQLNDIKSKRAALEQDKTNQLRLVQINTFYAERYQAHAELLKILVYMLIPLLFIAFIRFQGYLPNFIFYPLFLGVAGVGSYFFWQQLYSILRRDNMNYQEYEWAPYKEPDPISTAQIIEEQKQAMDKQQESGNTSSCNNAECCSGGTLWDPLLAKCLPLTKTAK